MQINFNSMPAFLNNEETKEKAKTIGAPAILSAGAAFLASKSPKDAPNPVKITKRLSKAGKAGIITAAVMALLTINKDKVVSGINSIKDKITSKKSPDTNKIETAQNPANMETAQKTPEDTIILPQETLNNEAVPEKENKAEQIIPAGERESEASSGEQINPDNKKDDTLKKIYIRPQAAYTPQNDGKEQSANPFAAIQGI